MDVGEIKDLKVNVSGSWIIGEIVVVGIAMAVVVKRDDVGEGKVLGDLWHVWSRNDVEEEENEVVPHGEEEVVGDGNV